ncbi:MAG: TlpA disulfide reductase family protein [Bacteroidales bacterium]|jgi:thiol-disulfide isomerase/thioredoxin|nr:TlpA disulfide reductase family protein [Bacteroidales bacterium]
MLGAKRSGFLILIFTLFSFSLFAQKYPVYNFETFSPLLEKQNDTTYVLNFWATWCSPCVKEMPSFNKLHEQYKDKKIKIILVSLDFGKNLQSKIDRFAQTHNIKPDIIILDDPDSNAWIDRVNKDWSGAIPATLIYHKNHRKFYEQSFTYKELESALHQILTK